MEREAFVSGYCRTIDGSRMVTVEIIDGKLEEVDCCYVNCPYTPNCQIAQKIRQLLEEAPVC